MTDQTTRVQQETRDRLAAQRAEAARIAAQDRARVTAFYAAERAAQEAAR